MVILKKSTAIAIYGKIDRAEREAIAAKEQQLKLATVALGQTIIIMALVIVVYCLIRFNHGE